MRLFRLSLRPPPFDPRASNTPKILRFGSRARLQLNNRVSKPYTMKFAAGGMGRILLQYTLPVRQLATRAYLARYSVGHSARYSACTGPAQRAPDNCQPISA